VTASVAIVGAVMGVMGVLVIRYTTNAAALREVWRKMQAHFLEFRLFFDEPRLVWRAQVGVLRENARLGGLLLVPALILAAPMTWLVMQLDVVYGRRPIAVGEAVVVTAQLDRAINPADRFDLRGSAAFAVETPVVRLARENQVAWRIRAEREGRGALQLTVNDRVIGKSVAGGESARVVSPRRASSLADFILHPEEPRLTEGEVEWVSVAYPRRDDLWMVWFVGGSLLGAVMTAACIR
jgi:hypothetical protein